MQLAQSDTTYVSPEVFLVLDSLPVCRRLRVGGSFPLGLTGRVVLDALHVLAELRLRSNITLGTIPKEFDGAI